MLHPGERVDRISPTEEEAMATKVVRCREVGVDCDFEARGQNEDEVLRQCADHARSAHGMTEHPRNWRPKSVPRFTKSNTRPFRFSRGRRSRLSHARQLTTFSCRIAMLARCDVRAASTPARMWALGVLAAPDAVEPVLQVR